MVVYREKERLPYLIEVKHSTRLYKTRFFQADEIHDVNQ